jgi:hypothetical protein
MGQTQQITLFAQENINAAPVTNVGEHSTHNCRGTYHGVLAVS